MIHRRSCRRREGTGGFAGERWRGVAIWRCAGALALLALAGPPSRADIVLLDEYWSPEILVDGVVAAEVDAETAGEPDTARTGTVSVRLSNATGTPNVRFRSAAQVVLDELPAGQSELSLWYRSDRWTGRWAVELWVFHGASDPAPVQALRATLDAGGPNGALVADDTWHPARGTLTAGEAYRRVPHNVPLASYVWLVPLGGRDLRHHTFVDRIEVRIREGSPGAHPAPAAAARVRPQPGAQSAGPGWIWCEGEDALSHDLPTGGVFGPDNAEEQAKLSNGAWLQSHDAGTRSAVWELDVAAAAEYALWCRALGAPFMWRWGDTPWQRCSEDMEWMDEVKLRDHAEGPIVVHWVCLGKRALAVGRHRLEVGGVAEDPSLAIDCWLLSRKPFTPHGCAKPGSE